MYYADHFASCAPRDPAMKHSSCQPWCVLRTAAFIALVGLGPPAAAQGRKEAAAAFKGDPALLTLDRIFSTNDLEPEKAPALRWRKRGGGYVSLEPAKAGQQLVAHDPATGTHEVLVPDHWLIPAG